MKYATSAEKCPSSSECVHHSKYGLIRETGATIAFTIGYLIPIFSTTGGVLILAEPLTWYEPVGAVVVILGVAVNQGRFDWIVRTGVQSGKA